MSLKTDARPERQREIMRALRAWKPPFCTAADVAMLFAAAAVRPAQSAGQPQVKRIR